MYKLVLRLFLLLSLPASARQIHVAVLDTGVPNFKTDVKFCPNGIIDATGTDVYDKLGHGTNILGIIADRLKQADYCVYMIKIYTGETKQSKFIDYLKALMVVYYLPDIDIVNYSSTGQNFDPVELVLISGLMAKGVKFVAAAGNEGKNLDASCHSFPACYPNVVSVGNGHSNSDRISSSNYGKVVKQWRYGWHVCGNGQCMSGSSQSTAIYSADLANKMYKDSLKHEN